MDTINCFIPMSKKVSKMQNYPSMKLDFPWQWQKVLFLTYPQITANLMIFGLNLILDFPWDWLMHEYIW